MSVAKKYLKEVDVSTIPKEVINVLDIIESYTVAKTLSGENGKDIEVTIAITPDIRDVFTIIGKNYRINITSHLTNFIFCQTIVGHSNYELIQSQIEEMGLNHSFKPVIGNNNRFKMSLNVVFENDKLDLQKIMKLLTFFDIQ